MFPFVDTHAFVNVFILLVDLGDWCAPGIVRSAILMFRALIKGGVIA